MKKIIYCLGLTVFATHANSMLIVVDNKTSTSGSIPSEPFIQPEEIRMVKREESNDFIKDKMNQKKPRWQR